MKMGIGDWGLGIGDWANPQSPIPNLQSPNQLNNNNLNFLNNVYFFIQKQFLEIIL